MFRFIPNKHRILKQRRKTFRHNFLITLWFFSIPVLSRANIYVFFFSKWTVGFHNGSISLAFDKQAKHVKFSFRRQRADTILICDKRLVTLYVNVFDILWLPVPWRFLRLAFGGQEFLLPIFFSPWIPVVLSSYPWRSLCPRLLRIGP